MPRYDAIYSRLAERAVKQGGVDFETFIEQALASGMDLNVVRQQLNQDLDNNGPIFGKFMRSLVGAAESAIVAAENQGALAGYAAEMAAMQELLSTEEMLAAESADPAALESVETKAAEVMEMTWKATLVNTCHLCLPLHGKTMRLIEWQKRGFLPSEMHRTFGPNAAACKCQLIPAEIGTRTTDKTAPLVRTKLEPPEGKKVSRKTQRATAQRDIDKAQAAIEKALQSETGRRTLRLMGQIDPEGLG